MKKAIIAVLALFLTACEQAPASYQPEPFAFEASNIATIKLNVAEIKIVDGYHSPLRKPNVEQNFPTPPAAAVKKWLAHRLKAVGTSGVLEVAINDASVKEVPLPKTKGVEGLFTDDQDARYDARISVTYRVFSGATGRAMSDATGDIEISRSRSINERATLYEREQMFHSMARDMMTSFDSESEKRLNQYFGAFLR